MTLAKSLQISTLALVALVPHVIAHSWVKSVTVGGTNYRGWDFNADPYYSDETRPESYTRKNDGNGPCLDWTAKCIIINEGANAEKYEATTPTKTIPAKAGDSVTLDWQQWPDSHIGGQAVYMADCGTTCEGADAASLDWFKIIEENYDTATKTWPLTTLTNNKGLYDFKLPTDLPGGAYMVKHELLAPFSGQQFYPMAFQIDLESSGSTVPSPVGKFPAMYADFVELTTDGASFKYPGIAVYQNGIVKGDSGGEATAPETPADPVDPTPSSTRSSSTNVVAQPTIVAPTPSEVSGPPSMPSVSAIKPPVSDVLPGSSVAVSISPRPTGIDLPVEPIEEPTQGDGQVTVGTPIEAQPTPSATVTQSAQPVTPTTSIIAPFEPSPSASASASVIAPAEPSPSSGTEGNLQGFTGTIGAAADPVTKQGDQYASGGRTYNFLYDALEGSCNDQRNTCYNASNQLPNAQVGAFQAECETQANECLTFNRGKIAVARRWSSRM